MYNIDEINEMKKIIRENWYAKDYIRPTFHLFITIILMFVLLFLINKTRNRRLLAILLTFLALCFPRIFMILHDLTHRSYFPSDERQTGKDGINVNIARCVDVLCAYDANTWKTVHSEHHRVHGNLNETDNTKTVLTSSKYNSLPKYQQIIYDIIRFPPIFFLLTPIYVFYINKFFNHEWEYIAKYTLFLTALHYFGSWRLVGFFVFAQYIGTIFGTMLFHLQHQVNVGYWKPFDNEDALSKANAELQGASVLKMPWFLEFFSFGIEYHNVHHLDPGIPGYNTKACYYDLVEKGLIPDNKVGYLQTIQSLMHTIYNEETELYE
jgi:omega-6 fatty acid desaturase (delta-12 desaturase)